MDQFSFRQNNLKYKADQTAEFVWYILKLPNINSSNKDDVNCGNTNEMNV